MINSLISKKLFILIIIATIIGCTDEQPILPVYFTLSTSVLPEGSGIVDPDGGNYEEGTQLTITGIPVDGFSFRQWTGSLQEDENPSTVLMDSDKIITAVFIKDIEPSDSLLDDYSEINKKTSWYITNRNYNYFNISYTDYRFLNMVNMKISPSASWVAGGMMWTSECGGYLYSDFNQDGTKELWQYYMRAPWPTNYNGIHLYSDHVQNIIESKSPDYNSEDHYSVLGLTHVRKQVLSDLDNDGIQEIIIFSHGFDKAPYPGDSLAIFYPSEKRYKYLSSDIGFFHGGATGDIDKNGFIDIVAYSGWSEVIPVHPTAYLNQDGESFIPNNTIFSNFTYRHNFYTVELFDINGDDNLDLFLGSRGRFYAVMGTSSGAFDFNNRIYFQLALNEEPMDIDFFDFNSDGSVDILLLNNLDVYDGYNIKILIQSEEGYLDKSVEYFDVYRYKANNTWIKWLFLKDIDSDGDIDIVADGLFGLKFNNNTDIVYWENIDSKFFYRQIPGRVEF
jgi:hypothetical protein